MGYGLPRRLIRQFCRDVYLNAGNAEDQTLIQEHEPTPQALLSIVLYRRYERQEIQLGARPMNSPRNADNEPVMTDQQFRNECSIDADSVYEDRFDAVHEDYDYRDTDEYLEEEDE